MELKEFKRSEDPWMVIVRAMAATHDSFTVEDVMNALKLPSKHRNELAYKRVSDAVHNEKEMHATAWERYTPIFKRPFPHPAEE